MWNEQGLVENLNSCRRVYFLRQQLLYYDTVLKFGQPRFFLWCSTYPSSISDTVPRAQTIIPTPSLLCSITFLTLWQGPGVCPAFYFLLFLLCDPLERQNPLVEKLFSCSIKPIRISYDRFWLVHKPNQILLFCAIPSRSLSSHCHANSYISFIPVYSIRL